MRVPVAVSLVLLPLAGCGSSSSPAAEPLRVLVTNDDGVGAPGIDALVEALRANPALQLDVVAPAVNQSGSGDRVTTTPLAVMPATTAAGFPAIAVDGEPADSVLFALRQALPAPPDLVVSGINAGQNVAEFVYLSGTVGAARWAARSGVPGLAFSLGFPAADYGDAAAVAAELVERFRTDAAFRRRLAPPDAPEALFLNVNVPSCADGARRGIAVVPVGRSTQVVAYSLLAADGAVQTWQPEVATVSPFATDCTSTLTGPASDVEALANGFASVTPLGPDLTQERSLDGFGDLARP